MRATSACRTGGKVSESPTEFDQTFNPPDQCGLRRRKLLSVRWRDVDLKTGQWRIPAEFIKTAEDYHAPIPTSVVAALNEFRTTVAESCKRQGLSVGKRLSADATIFGLTPTSDINPAFRTAVKRAGRGLGRRVEAAEGDVARRGSTVRRGRPALRQAERDHVWR